MTSKNFLITGVGQGLGRAFAEAALAAGHRVAGTVRTEAARRDFEALAPGRSKAVILDVTDFNAIGPAVAEIETGFGPVDILVNNAGYGHEGIVEESPLDELLRQFDVNVFGAIAMIRAVLPGMRTRRRGRIVNITSMAGIAGLPGVLCRIEIRARRYFGGARERASRVRHPRHCTRTGFVSDRMGGRVDDPLRP